MSNFGTGEGGRQVFGAVAGTDANVAALIRRSLAAVGQTAETAFTDGCPGLQGILTEAGLAQPPIPDWFHIAMRLQHATQAADGLSTDQLRRIRAKAAIIEEVDRLHWQIWNGKAKDAQITIDRIRKFMHYYKGERGSRTSHKSWHALHEVNEYLRSRSARLVNYAARYRAGLRVGTSVTEGTANVLVTGERTSRSRCGRPGELPICCCRSAVQSTMAHAISTRGPKPAVRQWSASRT